MAVFDLAAVGEQCEEPEGSVGMDDADTADITNFRAMASDSASAVPELSCGCRAGSGGQTYRDDVTGAALDLELVASARAEEIRFMGSWRVWDVRPISECVARAGKRPIGGRW
eukprot:5017483-Alexandrium_andersonii.AAC.1